MEFNVTLEIFEAHWDCTSRMYFTRTSSRL